MDYKPIFDPTRPVPRRTHAGHSASTGDRRDGSIYVYTDNLVLTVNTALATGRPLLLRGPSGTGKSSLARNVARTLGWRYYEAVITSRTQARDLLWEVDLLRRLHDAQLRDREFSADVTPYIKPGVLWWAFNPESASRRGRDVKDPGLIDPTLEPGGDRSVVLIDEIDKAEPDVPNNLLVPLGSLQFQVDETGAEVKTEGGKAPLVIITSNDERELPAACMRRCVQRELELPDGPRLTAIAKQHFPEQNRKRAG